MVGVGGRSKACENCRRRRIKCDQTRPHCNRCQRANLQCEGYRSMTIISYEGGRLRPTSIRSKDAGFSVTIGDLYLTSLCDLRLSLSLDEVVVSFARSKLLQGNEDSDQDIINRSRDNRNLTHMAFMALATTYYGTERKELGLVKQGLRRYGYALEEVNKALSNPVSRLHSYDLLEALGNLALFEFLVSENENGWVMHARGLESLIEMRGPESFTSLPELINLERFRPSIIFAAQCLHVPTIFSRPEWQTIPWMLYPNRKTPMQFLVDILSHCPELFCNIDKVEESAKDGVGYDSFVVRATALLAQLSEWERKWNIDHPDSCFEAPAPLNTPASTNAAGELRPMWSTVLYYSSLYHSNTVCVYQATTILVLRVMKRIELLRGGELAKEHQLRLVTAGITICRSIEFHTREGYMPTGSFAILFPVRMAFDAVGQFEPTIGAWLKGILQGIHSGAVAHWSIAKYLLKMSRPDNDRIAAQGEAARKFWQTW